MAASAPAPGMPSWNDDPESASTLQEPTSLEIGMSGMSLVTSLQEDSARKESSSTVSSSPEDDYDDGSHRQQLMGRDARGKGSDNGSPPTLDHDINQLAPRGPPGLGGTMPSPVNQANHSKNSSATSQILTLTPNSSVDGNSADWQSSGRQSSPFPQNDVPPMPFLNAVNVDQRAGNQNDDSARSFGGYDGNDNDRLLGLGELRERAYSSPGPGPGGAPGPSLARGYLPSHGGEHAQDRVRLGPRDRPPLSQPYAEDRSSLPFSTSSRGSDVNNVSLDSAESRPFGAIARPELRQSATEFDPTKYRSDFSGSSLPFQPSGMPGRVAEKFGSLPTFNIQSHQQRPPETFADVQKPRHTRSVSQPVLNNLGYQTAPPPPHYSPGIGSDGRYYPGSVGDHNSRIGGGIGRSASVSNPPMSTSFDNPYGLGSSLPNIHGAGGYQHFGGGYPSINRRDALDFPTGSVHSGGSLATSDDHRYGPSTISPAHSPLQYPYSSHSRQASDSAPSMMSSSPMSLGSVRRQSAPVHRPHSNDDDLTHPLVGENIEVPADHDDLMVNQAAHLFHQGHPHPLMRNQSHGPAMGMDQITPPFGDHLPTAGSAFPVPKVVYCVKFKRTQRNFMLGPRISRDLKIGTYVKVEADRGEDLGIVVGRVASDKYSLTGRSSFTAGMGPPGGLGGAADLKRIIRLATHDEVSLLGMKRDEEEELLKICRAKVRQRGLPMNVVDAEYQFDRHKLTFFFEAEGRVDFRELVRDLFSMYKTRIWMQQLDKNTSTSAQAIIAPTTSNVQMDFGTPIIAPVSEFADSIVMGGDARSH